MRKLVKSVLPTRRLRPSAFAPWRSSSCLLDNEGSLSPDATSLWAVMGHGSHSPSMCRLPLSQFTGDLMLGDKRLGSQSCSRAQPHNPLARLQRALAATARTGIWRPQAQSRDCRRHELKNGFMTNGLAPGAASLSALSRQDLSKPSGLIASKILYKNVGTRGQGLGASTASGKRQLAGTSAGRSRALS